MPLALVLALVFGAGMLIAAQPTVNAELTRHLGSPTAATLLSLSVSILSVLPFALLADRPRLDALGAVPPWAWLGGLAGSAFVMVGLLFVPRIGAAYFLVAAISGQLVAAALIDHFGLFNTVVRSFDLTRAAGLALVVAGVVVFRLGRG